MMQFLKENKMITLGGFVVLLGAFLYYTYFSGPSNTATVSSETISPASHDLLVTLSNLHTIRLNEKIFTDPVFLSLVDFGVTLPLENVGRPNPFAPLSAPIAPTPPSAKK